MATLPRTLLLSLSAQPFVDGVVDPAYWLGNCEGFRVDGPDGRIGIVVGCSRSSGTVTVRTGMFRPRDMRVSFTDVAEVHPQGERLLLRLDPRPART